MKILGKSAYSVLSGLRAMESSYSVVFDITEKEFVLNILKLKKKSIFFSTKTKRRNFLIKFHCIPRSVSNFEKNCHFGIRKSFVEINLFS